MHRAILVAFLVAAALPGCAGPPGEPGEDAAASSSPAPSPPVAGAPPEAAPTYSTTTHQLHVNASFGAAGVTFLRTDLPLPAASEAPGGVLLEAVVSGQAVGLVMVQVEDKAGDVVAEGAQAAAGDAIRVLLPGGERGQLVAYFSARSDGSVVATASCLVYLTAFRSAAPEGFTAIPSDA